MKHIGALILKFVIIAVVLELALLNLTVLSFGSILTIALTVTILAYLIGDMAILPNSNNTVATIVDIGLSAITIWLFNYIFPGAAISFFDALIASIGIGIGEWVFHKFVSRSVLPAQR